LGENKKTGKNTSGAT